MEDMFLSWIDWERITRLDVSRNLGFRENIVYTKEGQRRNGFHRVNYVVVGEGQAARNLDVYMENFGGRRVKEVGMKEIQPEDPRDMPGLSSLWSWSMGCPCCDQFIFEKHHRRPSNLRTNIIGTKLFNLLFSCFQKDMILCAIFVERTAFDQLRQQVWGSDFIVCTKKTFFLS